jgi:prolyl-tRNA editing enzyme YbaK/EbsC (Cys-tRNA(Pro) deacylase)
MPGEEKLHPSAQRVVDVLMARGVSGPFREFTVPTRTAADAAAALHCEVGAIASTLVFMADDEPVVVLKSGAFRVDTEILRQHLGATYVRQATPDEVREATGQTVGGVSPVGWPQPIQSLIDNSLADFAQVWAACGTPNAVFGTSFGELRSLTGAAPISLRQV